MMKEPMFRSPTKESSPVKKVTLESLDIKGREIAGLEPKMERFSVLPVVSEDDPDGVVVPLESNHQIVTEVDFDDTILFVNPTGGEVLREVAPPHWRSVTKDSVYATYESPKYGQQFYYEVNTKGVGYLKPTVKGEHTLDEYDSWLRVDEYNFTGAYGMADHDDFFIDGANSIVTKSRHFTNIGLRTELYWFIGKLNKIYYKGELRSVDELQNEGILPDEAGYETEIGVRFMKTNTRIAEVAESDPERSEMLFRNAYETYNKELQDLSPEADPIEFRTEAGDKAFYLSFAQRMGKNLATLINNGYVAWHLHSANTTMAAEIVDIGPIQKWRNFKKTDETMPKYDGVRRGTIKDFRDVAYSLKLLHKAGGYQGLHVPSKILFTQILLNAFNHSLDNDLLAKQEVSRTNLQAVAEKIFMSAIVHNVKLGAIKHGVDVADWGIGLTRD